MRWAIHGLSHRYICKIDHYLSSHGMNIWITSGQLIQNDGLSTKMICQYMGSLLRQPLVGSRFSIKRVGTDVRLSTLMGTLSEGDHVGFIKSQKKQKLFKF